MGLKSEIFMLNEKLRATLDAAYSEAAIAGGEVPEHLGAELDELELSKEELTLQCLLWIKERQALRENLLNWASGAQIRASRIDTAIVDMSARLLALNGGTIKVEYAEVEAKTITSSRVEIVDEGLVPVDYWREKTKVERSVDKVKVKDYISSGKEVPGCAIRINNNLKVK
jgi:hypothetical protein